MKFSLRFPFIADQQQQSNNEDLLAAVNALGVHLNAGEGVPSHTPAGPELYFQKDGPAVYIYNGSWSAL